MKVILDTNVAVLAALAKAGIAYTAVFVPQSVSRNAGKEPCLNWRVTLTSTRASLATDYMQGIGHVPGLKIPRRKTLDDEQNWLAACERGLNPMRGMKRLDKPHAADVIHSLLLDSDVTQYACFEDWADSVGYDTDSRAAEAIYNACKLIARDFNRVINAETRAKLAELLEGY